MLATAQKRTKRGFRTRSAFRKKSNHRVRLSVFRSGKHIYAQVIDDVAGKTLASASTVDKALRSSITKSWNVEAAVEVGKAIAERAKSAGVEEVAFDRGPFRYHGRIKALADAAREQGLTI